MEWAIRIIELWWGPATALNCGTPRCSWKPRLPSSRSHPFSSRVSTREMSSTLGNVYYEHYDTSYTKPTVFVCTRFWEIEHDIIFNIFISNFQNIFILWVFSWKKLNLSVKFMILTFLDSQQDIIQLKKVWFLRFEWKIGSVNNFEILILSVLFEWTQ